MPIVQQLSHDIAVELRMALRGDQAILLVHALHVAARRVAQVLDRGRVGEYCVLVHLVDGLRGWGDCVSIIGVLFVGRGTVVTKKRPAT